MVSTLVPPYLSYKLFSTIEVVTSAISGNYLLSILLFTTGVVFIRFICWVWLVSPRDNINVPEVARPTGIFGRWKTNDRWGKESQRMIDEGMLKYGDFGKPFKIRTPQRWVTFITSPTILNELKALPPSIGSFREAIEEWLWTEYTLHKGLVNKALYVELVRKNATEKINRILPEVISEVIVAWDEYTDVGDEWTKVNPYEVMLKVVSRATNRIYIGLPLCRNEEYMDAITIFSSNVVSTATYLDGVPSLLKPLVAKLLLRRNDTLRTVLKHVGPIFEERKRKGPWKDEKKPDDAFQWIVDAAPPGTGILEMTMNLLFLNLVAIHTTSITITHLLYDLAANPRYQAPLRDEVEETLKGGWTKQALVDMKKVDSVLRESGRMNGTNHVTLLRKVISSHTFSDGTHVTKGSWVAAPATSIHRSANLYENPNNFNGFRFSDMRKLDNTGNANRFQNVSTSSDYLPFGNGVGACPGRFFATGELKVMIAYLLCNYDFKFENEMTPRPKNIYGGLACSPDTRVPLFFKSRKDRCNSVLSSERLRD